MRIWIPSLALLTALVVPGCSKPDPAPPAPAAQPTAAAAPAAPADPAVEAKKIFKTRCVVCHGEGGKGDGAGAAALKVKPRDMTDAAWQTATTDEAIQKVIIEGGAAVGKDPGMPGNPDLRSKAEIVTHLVKIVRGFKG